MSKPFDTTLKQATHRRPIDWMYLFGMMGQFQVTWIDTDVSTVSLVADRVLRVNGAKPWIMHLEFQSSNDSDLELRLLSYNTLLRNRLGIPVDTCLLLLRPTAGSRKITGNFETKNHDGTVCSIFNFHVVKTWELSPQALLEGRIATVCLLPLSNVKKGELRKYLRLMKARIEAEIDPAEIEEFWTNIFILMGLKYEVADIRELLQGVVDVRGSASYQAVLEEGREEGEERGRLKAALRILVNSGTKKHGEPSKKVHQRLSTVSDPELLEQLAAEIRDMASWDELIARLD